MFTLDKNIIILVTLVLAISILVTACSGRKDAKVIARVNGENIIYDKLVIEYYVKMLGYISEYGEEAVLDKNSEGKTILELLRDDALYDEIVKKLVAQDAKKEGIDIEVTDTELKEKYDKILESVGGKKPYSTFLEQSGITDEYFQNNLKEQILLAKYKENFIEKNGLSEEEIPAYYDENKDSLLSVKASHIIVSTEEEGQAVLDKLNNGEDFAEVAKTDSLDTASGANGGDLGYFRRGEMIEGFDEAAFTMKVGETSKLVKSDLGYHIIRVEDRKESFDELKDDINYMINEELFSAHLKEMQEVADIEIDEDLLAKFDLNL